MIAAGKRAAAPALRNTDSCILKQVGFWANLLYTLLVVALILLCRQICRLNNQC